MASGGRAQIVKAFSPDDLSIVHRPNGRSGGYGMREYDSDFDRLVSESESVEKRMMGDETDGYEGAPRRMANKGYPSGSEKRRESKKGYRASGAEEGGGKQRDMSQQGAKYRRARTIDTQLENASELSLDDSVQHSLHFMSPLGTLHTGTEITRVSATKKNQIMFANGLNANFSMQWFFYGEVLNGSEDQSSIPPFIIKDSVVASKFHHQNQALVGSGGEERNERGGGSGGRIQAKSVYVVENYRANSFVPVANVHDPFKSAASHNYGQKSGQGNPETEKSPYTPAPRLIEVNRLSDQERTIMHQNKGNQEILILEVRLHGFNNPLPFPVGVVWNGYPITHCAQTGTGTSYLFVLPPCTNWHSGQPRCFDIREKLNLEDARMGALFRKQEQEGFYSLERDRYLVYCDKLLYTFLKRMYPNKQWTAGTSMQKSVVIATQDEVDNAYNLATKTLSMIQFVKYNQFSFSIIPIIQSSIASLPSSSSSTQNSLSEITEILMNQHHQEWKQRAYQVNIDVSFAYL